MTDNRFPPGSPEAAEFARISASPSAHGRLGLDPSAPVAPPRAVPLAELEDHAAGLAAAGVIFGPDTSQYQGSPAWGTVKASGCTLGFYKVSEGRTYEDPSHRWSKARVPGAGLVSAGYHFLYFSQEYVDKPALWGAQADFFCSLVDPNAGHVLDVEAAATAGHHLGVKEWVAEYRRLFPGHPLGLYANLALWQNRSRMPYDPTGLFDFVWHAGVGNGFYTSATGTIAQQWAGTSKLTNSFAAKGYPACELWQITDHASVPGVGGSFCDGNAFQGTTAELTALLTTGDTDMPLDQADKDFINQTLRQTLAGYADDYANAAKSTILGASLGNSGPTVAVALQSGYQMTQKILGQTDTLEASEAAQTAALAALNPDALADTLAGKLTAGLQVQGVDYDKVRQLLSEGLDEHLASLRIVTAEPSPA